MRIKVFRGIGVTGRLLIAQHSRFDARLSFHRGSSTGAAILEKPVSDRGTLEDLSQSAKP